MITHYFTLKALAKELDRSLKGATVAEAYSQQKNELAIGLDLAHKEEVSLLVSVDPVFNFIYLRKRVSRAKKNSVDLFPEIIGTKVGHTGVQLCDRIIEIQFAGGLSMLFQLYNTVSSNVFLIDEKRTIQNCFKRRTEFGGTVVPILDQRFTVDLLDHPDGFIAKLLGDSEMSVLTALKHAVPLLGTVYAREALFVAGIDEKAKVNTLANPDFGRIHDELRRMFQAVSLPQPRVYFNDRKPEFLSIIPLRHFPVSAAVAEFGAVNDAIVAFVQKNYLERGREEKKDDFLGKLRNELHRLSRSLTATREQLEHADRAGMYDRMGRLVLAAIHTISKGMKEVTVDDIITSGCPVTIPLEPQLSPAKNAERYFEKARKARVARREAGERLARLDEKVRRLEMLRECLEHTETPDQVKEFIAANRDALIGLKLMTEKPNDPPPPFRIFAVAGGLEVWVGKNSANNDLLTTKYAKPNDLWFHVRGAGGSHTILRVTGNAPPPKEAIRQAASIAAYYSKMRKAGTVPVAYCERKYVRKPKGVKEGLVIIEREAMVFVKPQLP